MITADIYPLIKCGKLNYDDITIINKISLHDINDDKMIEYKKEAIEELLSSFKSHSTKSSLKQKLFKKSDLSTNNFTQPEKNLIALLALVKIGRDQWIPSIDEERIPAQKNYNEFSVQSNLNTLNKMNNYAGKKVRSSDHSHLLSSTKDLLNNLRTIKHETSHEVSNGGVDFSEPLDSTDEISMPIDAPNKITVKNFWSLPSRHLLWDVEVQDDFLSSHLNDDLEGDNFIKSLLSSSKHLDEGVNHSLDQVWWLSEHKNIEESFSNSDELFEKDEEEQAKHIKMSESFNHSNDITSAASPNAEHGISEEAQDALIVHNIKFNLVFIPKNHHSINGVCERKTVYNIDQIYEPISVEITSEGKFTVNVENENRLVVTTFFSQARANNNEEFSQNIQSQSFLNSNPKLSEFNCFNRIREDIYSIRSSEVDIQRDRIRGWMTPQLRRIKSKDFYF
jgi:hypothetical protein